MRRTLGSPTHLEVRVTRGSAIDIDLDAEISEGGLSPDHPPAPAPGTSLSPGDRARAIRCAESQTGRWAWIRAGPMMSDCAGRDGDPSSIATGPGEQAAIGGLVDGPLPEAL